MKPTPKELRNLRYQLRHHDIMYRRGAPEIEDACYDGMYALLLKWESQWPDLKTSDSPTQTVETPDDGSEKPWYDDELDERQNRTGL